MTGFGAAGPAEPPAATQPAHQPEPPVSPQVVTAFEGSIDERLNALLGQ